MITPKPNASRARLIISYFRTPFRNSTPCENMTFFRTWKGQFTSSWDKAGDSPRDFRVHFEKKSSGKLKGHGTSPNGRRFTIHRGTYLTIGGHYGVEFDMVFDDGSPTERFGGEEHQNGHIKGTIKLKNARSLIEPGMMGRYEDYRDYTAFVNIH